MTAPEEELEKLIVACRTRLSGIDLVVADIDAELPAPFPKISLDDPIPDAPPPRKAGPIGAVSPAVPNVPPRNIFEPPARAPEPVVESAAKPPPETPAAPKPAPNRWTLDSVLPTEQPSSRVEIFPRPNAAPLDGPRKQAPVPAASTAAAIKLGASRWAYAVAAAAFLATGVAFVEHLSEPPLISDSFRVDGAEALAVQTDHAGLVIARTGQLDDIRLDGTIRSSRPLPSAMINMQMNKSELWSVDGEHRQVRVERDGSHSTVFPLNHVPGAVFVKDTELWTAEKDGRGMHQYLISRSILGPMLQPLDAFEIENITPEVIAIDRNGLLLIIDDQTRSIYRLRSEGGIYKIQQRADLSALAGGAVKFHGCAIDEKEAWFLVKDDTGAETAKRVELARLSWTIPH